MKTLKTLLSVFAIAAVFSAGAYAQNNTNDITASAEVLSAITVTNTQNLSFGDIADGLNKTLSLDDANSGSLGVFTVSGLNSGSDVELSLDGPASLAGVDGQTAQTTLPFTMAAGYANTNSGTAASGNTISLTSNDGSTSISGNTDATLYVIIGGTIDATAGNYTDTYEGTITLSVAYL